MDRTKAARTESRSYARIPVLRIGAVLFLFAVLFRFFDEIARTALIAYAAAIVAVTLNTVVRRLPFERKWAALGVGVMFIALLVAAVWFGGSLLVDQLRSLLNSLPEIQAEIDRWARDFGARTGIRIDALTGPVAETLRAIATGGGGILSRVRGVLGAGALVLVVLFGGLFALAKPNDRLLNGLLRVAPVSYHDRLRRTLDVLAQRIVGFMQAKALAMLAVGTLATVLFLLLGVPYALLLGVFNAITEFVPILGPWVGGLAAVIVAAVTDPTKGALTAIAVVIIQVTENALITPLTMESRAKVHPFVTLLSLLLFGALFGFLGVLLAIPLVLLIWTVVEVFWVEARLHNDEADLEPVVEE
jgi:predicted PurR-regulated permease PerM